MEKHDRVSTGLDGFDQVIDKLRFGDNVVWQVDSIDSYREMVAPFVVRAVSENRNLVYIRFGSHEPVLEAHPNIREYHINAQKGFESFATEIHEIIEREGRKTFYICDCLTDLLENWHSDLMIGNFFKVTCPYLYNLDTIAYFAVQRNAHTFATIAGIRETTQLLLDLLQVNDKYYIHPLKVWRRYSPTMFLPHLIQGQEAFSITSSSEAAELFSSISQSGERLDYWNVIFNRAKEELNSPIPEQEQTKKLLMSMIIGNESQMFALCDRFFTLEDILKIASREVGTGFIGGKSVGMLLSRKILECSGEERFKAFLEPHDSYYLGSDIFYTYIVQNGWWELRVKQKTKEGYFLYASELRDKLLHGRFPENIQDKFVQMLEYFGQSPIIVRSSSLLEDNFGNAFAGKYESVFCVNQGTPEERYEAFEQAVRTVYASAMNEDALAYRMNRGLFAEDEQMAILVQRVSGDYYGESFFPHVAGVGNSLNLYVWDESIDINSGMLRMVFGLGTRAVDRIIGDYAKIITLDDPMRAPLVSGGDLRKFSQNYVDVLSLRENKLVTAGMEEVVSYDIKVDKELFASLDRDTLDRLRNLGYKDIKIPYILDFKKILRDTGFPVFMKDMLSTLSGGYNCPLDMEFTANFRKNGSFKVNLLQCRPMQTRGLGKAVNMPEVSDKRDCLFYIKGNFMGGNVRIPIDYIVFVKAKEYLTLPEQEKYSVARQIGVINNILKGKNVMLMGPGRWGTTTPSLGVPVHFTELSNMSAICEIASKEEGFMPELSYGSHFFLDIVETGIFYAAIFAGQKEVVFNPGRVLKAENMLASISPQSARYSDVIHIAQMNGMELFSDIVSQKLLCR
jgi:pyruvate,water dikinase